MDKDEHGCATDWVKRTQYPHCIRGAEPKDVPPFADHDGGLAAKYYKVSEGET